MMPKRSSMTAIAIALLCIIATSFTITGVNADGFAVCTFQGSDTISGYITFQQADSGAVVAMTSNFTSSSAVDSASLVIFTLGDLDATAASTCWVENSFGSWDSNHASAFTGMDTVTGFDVFGDNSIIGRSMGLYEGISSCEDAISATAIAQCVIGIRNVVGQGATNTAGQYLSESPVSAYAKFVGGSEYPDLDGCAYFVPTLDDEVYVKVKITGLSADTTHAIHVHEYGDITTIDGLMCGGHLNPYEKNHGLPPSINRHMGDLGNATADADGTIEFGVVFNLLSFTYSGGNILGRGMIVHALGDDGNPLNTSESTGAAGGRIARAVIGISERIPVGYEEVEQPKAGSLGPDGGLGYEPLVVETAIAVEQPTADGADAVASPSDSSVSPAPAEPQGGAAIAIAAPAPAAAPLAADTLELAPTPLDRKKASAHAKARAKRSTA